MRLPRRSSPRLWGPSTSQPRLHNHEAVASLLVSFVKVAFVVFLLFSSYLAGSLFGQRSLPDSTIMAHAPMSVQRMVRGKGLSPGLDHGDNAEDCEEAEKLFIERKVREEVKKRAKAQKAQGSSDDPPRLPPTAWNIIEGMARVKKDDLVEYFDFGNPTERGQGTGEEDALLLYRSEESLPSSDASLARAAAYDDGQGLPLTDPATATENCDALNVVFTANPDHHSQCTAIVGNFESYHIQRWMRVDTVTSAPIQPDLPLVHVSRGYASRATKGRSNFIVPPFEGYVKKHWTGLKTFLQHLEPVLSDLEPILSEVARNNAVVILTCNRGQSDLLMNFACSARRKGFDLGNVLVFPTDLETKDLAEGLGLATYYDEKVTLFGCVHFTLSPARHAADAHFLLIECRTLSPCPAAKRGVMAIKTSKL